MEEERKFVIVGGIGLLFVFTFAIVVTETPEFFYWGIPIGTVFGFATCIYLAGAWDPHLLSPKNPNTKKATWRIWWTVPLGIFVANISSKVLVEDVRQILLGTVIAWLYITFAYMIIQAWRYR